MENSAFWRGHLTKKKLTEKPGCGRAFEVPYKKAMKEAERQSELYNAPIVKMWEKDNG